MNSILNFLKKKQQAAPTQMEPQIPESLFFDTNPPIDEPVKISEREKINFIIEFDYESEGLKDGFNLPNQNILELKLERFKAELLKEYDSLIDIKNLKIQKLLALKSITENIDVLTAANIILDITNLETEKILLETEKEEIKIGSGSYKIISNNYRIGFIIGIENYKKSKIL